MQSKQTHSSSVAFSNEGREDYMISFNSSCFTSTFFKEVDRLHLLDICSITRLISRQHFCFTNKFELSNLFLLLLTEFSWNRILLNCPCSICNTHCCTLTQRNSLTLTKWGTFRKKYSSEPIHVRSIFLSNLKSGVTFGLDFLVNQNISL